MMWPRIDRTVSGKRLLREAVRVAIVVALACIGGAIVGGRPLKSLFGAKKPITFGSLPIPKEPVSLADAGLEGSATATVGLAVYSDFECLFCRRFAREVLPQIRSKYVDTGLMFVAFKNYPLQAHALGQRAAPLAYCAAQQGRFKEAHDHLFEAPGPLTPDVIETLPSRLRLNSVELAACLGPSGATITAGLYEARRLYVTSTPTFFLGKRDATGFHVAERFAGSEIEALLAALERMAADAIAR